MVNKKAVTALARNRIELEETTHSKILQAINRIKTNSTEIIKLKPAGKVTRADLALEAGVSRASLQGNHKILLNDLEKINNKRSVSVSDKRKLRERKEATDKELIKQLVTSKELLAQENFRINEMNKNLKRQLEVIKSQMSNKENIVIGNFKKY